MMIARAGLTQIVPLDTGHSPFVTAPEATAEAILAAIGN